MRKMNKAMDGTRRRSDSFHGEPHRNNTTDQSQQDIDGPPEMISIAGSIDVSSDDELQPTTRSRSNSVHANDNMAPVRPNIGIAETVNMENKTDKVERSSSLNLREVKALKMVSISI